MKGFCGHVTSWLPDVGILPALQRAEARLGGHHLPNSLRATGEAQENLRGARAARGEHFRSALRRAKEKSIAGVAWPPHTLQRLAAAGRDLARGEAQWQPPEALEAA